MTGALYLGVTRAPTEVPTLEPVLMGSAYGLLLNELQRSPEGLLLAAKQLLQCALDLDTGVSLLSKFPFTFCLAVCLSYFFLTFKARRLPPRVSCCCMWPAPWRVWRMPASFY